MSAADSDKPDANLPAFKPRGPLALSMPQREAVIERLTQSFAEDAITMDEFERRAELAYRAVSMADLQVLVSDLPAAPQSEGSAASKSKTSARVAIGDRVTIVLGSTERRMPGVMSRFFRVRTLLGNTELDFRAATFEPGVTEVNVWCLMGNVELTVPEGVRVEIQCSALLANVGSAEMGGSDFVQTGVVETPERVLRITGRAIMANVEVHKGPLRREP